MLMANPKWKYQKPKPVYDYGNKLYLEHDVPAKILISHWEFIVDSGNGPSFKCFVTKEDGEEVDKVWSVWDHKLKLKLKDKVKGKKAGFDKVEVTVTRKGEEMEEYFELS
jgi:hypothetical protein